MKTKHTPGPWKVINGTVYIGEAHDAVPDDRFCIAKMAREPRHHIPPTERDANARLIASAPDLLLAAKELQVAFFMVYGSEHPLYRRASEAIDKAEGKA